MLDYPFDTMNLYTPGQTFSVTHDFFCVLVYIKRVCFTVNEIYFKWPRKRLSKTVFLKTMRAGSSAVVYF